MESVRLPALIPKLDHKPVAILVYPRLFKSVPGLHRSGTTQKLRKSKNYCIKTLKASFNLGEHMNIGFIGLEMWGESSNQSDP